MAFYDDNPGLGDVIQLAVALEVVADGGIFRDADVLVENSPAHTRTPPDDAVVKDNRILNIRIGVDTHAPADDGATHQAAREDGATGHDGIERLAPAAVVIENELGGGVEVTSGSQRPLAIVEVQLGRDRPQVHV